MKIVIFGHRGVGKTSFLNRHQKYFPEALHFDLDLFIENKINMTITNYFQIHSEIEFRKVEIECFKEIYQNYENFVVAVGGGFDTSSLPKDVYKIYLSRVTDKDGRIFFDRPRLDLNKTAIEESVDRYILRQPHFVNNCNEIYYMNEGMDQHTFNANSDCSLQDNKTEKIEKLILSHNFEVNDAYITLVADQISNIIPISKNFKKIELRTDLIDTIDIDTLINLFPEVQWMVSFRQGSLHNDLFKNENTLNWIKSIIKKLGKFNDDSLLDRSPKDSQLENSNLIDFDLEFYELLNLKINLDYIFKFDNLVFSTHIDNIQLAIQNIENFQKTKDQNLKFHYKLCPIVENFEELRQGFFWQQQDILNRSFLPRTKNLPNSVLNNLYLVSPQSKNHLYSEGQWNWFRLLAKFNQKINFIRNKTNMLDQPQIFEWLAMPKSKPIGWGAVLGEPIYFSRSPIRHLSFISKKNSYFTKINIKEQDFELHLNWLVELGLKYICITSPLKNKAYQLAEKKNLSEWISSLKSINTMYLHEEKLISTNTDLEGFRKFVLKYLGNNFENFKQEDIVVWGGGGTLNMMQAVLPNAKYYSSQLGTERLAHASQLKQLPKVIIWAAPRANNVLFPTDDWPIELVLDLNYTDHSMGREYAQKIKIKNNQVRYVSGLEMFDEQALQQQLFWSQYEC